MSVKSAKKEVVLIVDDHPANLGVLSDYLERAGFEVWVAQDGESGIQKVEYAAPDIILLDIMMPTMDGFETCTLLKANPATKNIPVIFMSALSETVDKVKGLCLGAVDYITKPFQQEEVLVRVNLQLQLRALNKTLEEKNAMLSEFAAQLEERVDERTAQLKSALRELQQAHLEVLAKEEKLRYDADRDPLTGLHNRAWLLDRLNQAIELSGDRADYLYAVLFIDLDRFKVINDSLGHLVGDEFLKRVAKSMQTCLSSAHTMARLGGDEFIILLEDIKQLDEVTEIADRILSQLRKPIAIDNYKIFTGASIGITFSTMGYARADDVLRDADIAMYRAKVQGKGRYQVLTPAMQIQAAERLQLENDLRRAIDLQEFCLYYQPIISLSTGHLLGFEALVRWNHPSAGLISPTKFIPIAEEIGAIDSLGCWVFQEACRQMRLWQQQFPRQLPLCININVSPVQLKQINLVCRIEEILQDTGISRNSVKLEITESCLLETSTCAVKVLKQLKKLGIQLCIDDFGTGYSSLSRLHEFPIDTLKIDRAFVNRISTGQGEEMIKTIMTLARNFGMDVVAEGIETPEQLKKVHSLGCAWGQGYLFSKPVDSYKATLFVADRAELSPARLLSAIGDVY